ncbi:MAG TPA: MFS transporter [Gammaproteobacteria bacterium]|nr:MFS transporter [Gammaproteobacteria bacterium]
MKPTRARFGVLALITFATMLNYVDRSVMGVAQPSLVRELAISPELMGLIFSAFSWTYAFAQIPGGLVLDRLGARLTYTLSLGSWSLATMLHGFMSSVTGLFSARLALGLAEAPCFPTNSRILSTWFPQTERARANSVYAVGQYVGLGFMIPVLTYIVAAFGWRALFFIFGALGVVYAVIWHAAYREPHESRRANEAELGYIASGGGLADQGNGFVLSWAAVRQLLRTRQILGASIGQFCGNSTLVFFLTWFPSYLATERGMDWLRSGFAASLPYIAASVGVLVGGALSDGIIRRTGSATLGRKGPIVAGLLLTSTMVFANFTPSNTVVVAVMSVAFFGQGMANLGWTLIADVAPKQLMGLTGGIFNLCANLAGIVTPLVIGFVLGATGSFYGALTYIAALGLVGAAAYVFILGEVRRVEIASP